jgi:hypothetical protein
VSFRTLTQQDGISIALRLTSKDTTLIPGASKNSPVLA